MDVLRELIQTIVVIVVLAVIMEMLLPRGDMRRYVKMVMGLLIILAVMQSVVGAINSEFFQEVPQVTSTDSGAPSLDDIMAAGQQLSEINEEAAVHKYSAGVAKQVLSLAKLQADVTVLDAQVKIKKQSNNIDEITIYFGTGTETQDYEKRDGAILDVQPVVVNIDNSQVGPTEENVAMPTEDERKAASNVARTIIEFYNLNSGQVKVVFQ